MKTQIAPIRRKIVNKRRNKSKNELIKECLNRPCSVFLQTVNMPQTQAHQNLKLWQKHFRPFVSLVKVKKLDWQQEAEKECLLPLSVEMNEIRYAELKVTTHSTGTRQIDYTLKAKDYDETLHYEDLILEIIPVLPRLTNQPEPKSKLRLKDDDQPGNILLQLQFPQNLSYIFKVNDHKDDIPSIVWALAGRSMLTAVLDAYLTLKLEDYKRTAILQANNNQMKRTLAQRFQYLPFDFLLSFDQFKADCHNGLVRSFSQVEVFVKKKYPKYHINTDTILISPIYAKKHFYLAIFYFSEEVILIFDSCWKHFPNLIRVKNVRDVLRYLLIGNPHLCQKPEKWEIKFADHCAQQTDDHNCGCYVIKFMEYQLNGKGLSEECYQKVFSKEEIVEIRRNIVRKLLPTTRAGSQLLEAIME